MDCTSLIHIPGLMYTTPTNTDWSTVQKYRLSELGRNIKQKIIALRFQRNMELQDECSHWNLGSLPPLLCPGQSGPGSGHSAEGAAVGEGGVLSPVSAPP